MKQKVLVLIVIVILAFTGVYVYTQVNKNIQIAKISNFTECEAEGYPVQEIYPPICKTPDGRSFTQDIGNELEYSDFIKAESPRPNSKVVSPLRISGSARGNWFWEANSTAELYDANGKSLGTAFVIAQGDWMSEEFVPFEGTLEFGKPDTPIGKLVLRNDNPSGLPENQKELIIPIKF